jgi:hypothetical protein
MPMALPSRPDLTTYGRPKRRSKPCLSSERPGAMSHPHRRAETRSLIAHGERTSVDRSRASSRGVP